MARPVRPGRSGAIPKVCAPHTPGLPAALEVAPGLGRRRTCSTTPTTHSAGARPTAFRIGLAAGAAGGQTSPRRTTDAERLPGAEVGQPDRRLPSRTSRDASHRAAAASGYLGLWERLLRRRRFAARTPNDGLPPERLQPKIREVGRCQPGARYRRDMAGVSSETVAWIAAGGTAAGALIGSTAGGLVSFAVERARERRRAFAGARLVRLDLSLTASALRDAEHDSKWWVFRDVDPMLAWTEFSEILSVRLSPA
jgi:hypothetical protein